jgi:hypothetical protein
LASGGEVVVLSQLKCVAPQQGGNVMDGIPLTNNDVTAICGDNANPRRLSADLIKRLAAQKPRAIAPTGIRILGGVFCEGLDLVGLDIPYSLVLDYSTFRGTFNARNFRTKNDLSIDYALLLDGLLLTRANVGGSIYSSATFIGHLTATNTNVDGSWYLDNSVVLDDARMFDLSISGDFTLDKSALSWFWLQSSRVAGLLELNDTEARCAYHIKGSTVGYLTADRAGFGIVKSFPSSNGKPALNYSWWNRAAPKAGGKSKPLYVQEILGSQALRALVAEKERRIQQNAKLPGKTGNPAAIYGCDDSGAPSSDLEFLLVDTQVKTALCLTSFIWTIPKGQTPDESQPQTVVALRETQVGGSLILRPWSDDAESNHYDPLQATPALLEAAQQKNKFELIGLTAKVFAFNFKESAKPYSNFLDGLNFTRLEDTHPVCDQRTKELGSPNLALPGKLPNVNDAKRWLESNQMRSSQPYMVFINAFEKTGQDSTEFHIDRARADLKERALHLWEGNGPSSNAQTSKGQTASSGFGSVSAISVLPGATLISGLGDAINVSFQSLMWAVADFGFRPAKAVWWVLGVLLVFWIMLWFISGIIGFEPTQKKDDADRPPSTREAVATQSPSKPSEVWPISFLFLFDHLIPAYQIRAEHYAIEKVYRSGRGDGSTKEPASPMRYLGLRFRVREGNDDDKARLEQYLVVLRLLGIVLSVFLLAALNALISK